MNLVDLDGVAAYIRDDGGTFYASPYPYRIGCPVLRSRTRETDRRGTTHGRRTK